MDVTKGARWIQRILSEALHDSRTTCVEILKVTIPIIVIVRILEQLGLIALLSELLAALMTLVRAATWSRTT